MKTLVLFYSFSGKTKAIANDEAKKLGADVIEIQEIKKRSILNAYTVGCFQAMSKKKVKIAPLGVDLNTYNKIIILMPIWAGVPAPAFNSVAEILPKGKAVELIMTSGSGQSNKEKAMESIKKNGCDVLRYLDIKS